MNVMFINGLIRVKHVEHQNSHKYGEEREPTADQGAYKYGQCFSGSDLPSQCKSSTGDATLNK